MLKKPDVYVQIYTEIHKKYDFWSIQLGSSKNTLE